MLKGTGVCVCVWWGVMDIRSQQKKFPGGPTSRRDSGNISEYQQLSVVCMKVLLVQLLLVMLLFRDMSALCYMIL